VYSLDSTAEQKILFLCEVDSDGSMIMIMIIGKLKMMFLMLLKD